MKELLNTYRAALYESGGCFTLRAQPVNNADAGRGRSTLADVQHVLWMLDQMEPWVDMLDSGWSVQSKFHRWLGFVQGWLWTNRVFTLDQLRDQTSVALEC